jgi:large subunit ribosomal protein L9
MEIILKEDVLNLGFKDDIVNVKNGYGRNFLIPQGKAILATTSEKKILSENIKQKAFKEKKIIDNANSLAKKILKTQIKIKSKAGEGDKLFGSVNASDFSKVLKNAGFEIEKNQITLPGKTIKRLGKYEASIRLHREVVVNHDFEIISE